MSVVVSIAFVLFLYDLIFTELAVVDEVPTKKSP